MTDPAPPRRTPLRVGGGLAVAAAVLTAVALAVTVSSPAAPGATPPTPGATSSPPSKPPPTPAPPTRDEAPVDATTAPAATTTAPSPTGPAPAALVGDEVDLRAGPVPVPLALYVPSLGITADVLGVGLTDADEMDAPVGGLGDPVWDQAYWYRGSAVPGAASTALIAGHVGSRGGPAVFARLDELAVGDPVVVEDLRTGVGVRFVVTASVEYTLAEAARPDVLDTIYGAGPVAGTDPVPSADGLAHLTLITCSGTFVGDTYDRRRVVTAVAARP